jgi:predicted peroxiredoxin
VTGGLKAVDGPPTAWFQPGWVSMLFTSKDPEKTTLAMSLALGAAMQGLKPAVIAMHDGVWAFTQAGANKEAEGTLRASEVAMGEPYKACSDMIEKIRAKGGRFFACKSCVVHRKLKDKLDDYVDVTQGPDVVRMISGARGSVNLN